MAELIDNYYQINSFSSTNVTPMKIFQPRKKIWNKTFGKQTYFEQDYIFSFKTAISRRRDFHWTEFLSAILNFVFILPAKSIFLIFLCFPSFPVFSRLIPENRIKE